MTEPLPLGRRRIIEALASALEAEPHVAAGWLGGSDATGRTDEYSDVDIQVIAEDDRIEEAFTAAERALERLSPIAIRHRLPEPTWHGHAQAFYQLRDASRHHFVDLVVLKRSSTDRFLERERHGDARVLFDPEGIVVRSPLDRAAHTKRMAVRLAEIRATFPLFQTLVERAVARGHDAEAAYWYQIVSLKPAVELLRIRYCPDRFDFGFRYLDRDLPRELRSFVEGLVFPADMAALLTGRARIQTLVEKELAALDRGEWSLPTT